MSFMKLPLIEFTKSLHSSVCLKRTFIIAIQHLLDTTHTMFRSLYTFGIKPKNICVLGKCYSTNPKVARRMQEDGIYISPFSTQYDSHVSYDALFDKMIQQFLREILKRAGDHDKWIILDDGGHLISLVNQHFKTFSHPIVGIEQTSSGIERLKQISLSFPVFNIAHSNLKRKFESPWIASLIIKRIVDRIGSFNFNKRILIMGNGAVGSAFFSFLNQSCKVDICEKLDPIWPSLDDILPYADIVIGCTGTTSIPRPKHYLLKKNCILISASSSDREFDSVHLRRQLPLNDNCFLDLDINGVKLLNSGFPINFTGEEHSVSPEKIQLIRSLLFAGILQASRLKEANPGFIPLDDRIHTEIGIHFSRYYNT